MPSTMRAIGAAILVMTMLVAQTAEAKPKRYSFRNMCTQFQLEPIADNPGVQACIAQGIQDSLDGKPNYHYVACLPGGGVSCCQDYNETGSRSCDPIAVRSVLPRPVEPQQSAPITAD